MSTPCPLRTLLIENLKDLHDAETQLLSVLPDLAKAAARPDLRSAFKDHVAETRRHADRLAQAMELLGAPSEAKTCRAMTGLMAECHEAIALDFPPDVRDAALIGVAQRIEHYEIAAYGTARAFAQTLGEIKVADLLHLTLDEEGASNRVLDDLARTINADAAKAGDKAAAA